MRALIGPLVIIGLIVGAWMLFADSAPAGMSDARYEHYRGLSAPKLLFSCTRKPTDAALLEKTRACAKMGRSGCEQNSYDSREEGTHTEVDFAGGSDAATYREILERARRNCESSQDKMTAGTFKVLESAEK
jgi:hypothetical protein